MDHQQHVQQPGYHELQGEKAAQHMLPPQYAQAHQQAIPSYHAESSGPSQSSSGTLLTIKRSVALSILGAIVLLLLLVIGLSAGLGVSQNKLNRANDNIEIMKSQILSPVAESNKPVPTISITSLPPASPTPTPDPSRTSFIISTPSQTAALVQCPSVNNTVYTVTSASSGPAKKFTRLCGLDYGGSDEATDIGNVKVNSLDQCIEACAKKSGCTGAGWGVTDKANPLQSCWMKKGLKKPHDAKMPDWGFAVLVGGDQGGDGGDDGGAPAE
ncbi:hypothetical protein QBC43DRAFT_254111 [Cladorrhinum sp. PSN259]|nr:hypothetical protein QBC43DRAFT_254111 [Cladorrhinum sp. PSN259]